jgi:hypothetical protein
MTFLTNPLATILGALLTALGIYTLFLKAENTALTLQNSTLKAIEADRKTQEKAAIVRNKVIESIEKQKFQEIQKEADRAKKTANDQLHRINDLTRRLREYRCAVPTTPTAPEGGAPTSTPRELPNEGGTLLARLADEYTSLAASAEETRITALACQQAKKSPD